MKCGVVQACASMPYISHCNMVHRRHVCFCPPSQGSMGRTVNLTCTSPDRWSQDMGAHSRRMLIAGLPQVRPFFCRSIHSPSGNFRWFCCTMQSLRMHVSQSAYGLGLSETAAPQERPVLTSRSAECAVRQAIRSIVRRSSLRQACLGVVSGAGFRGTSYVIAKALKRWRN